MRLPYFDFLGPETVKEALAVMEHHGEARPQAGGTDLIPLMRLGLVRPSLVVGLKDVAGLSRIARDRQALRIGAMTTLSEVAASPAVRKHAPAPLLRSTFSRGPSDTQYGDHRRKPVPGVPLPFLQPVGSLEDGARAVPQGVEAGIASQCRTAGNASASTREISPRR